MTVYRLPSSKTTFLASLCMIVPLFMTACSSDGDSALSPSDQPEDNPETNPPSGNLVPGSTALSAIGDVLVFGDDNRTLYTFANDADGQSNCSGGCAEVWPPAIASEVASSGDFSTITRDDNTLQWAFKDRPLYFYQGDAVEGEINGEGINGVWYVARPDPVAVASSNLGDLFVASGTTNNGTGDAADRTDFDGFTLYTFRNDSAGVSTCNEGCATAWPPLFADQGAVAYENFSIISRDDNTRQWAYNGQALYFYQGDSAPGDTLGDGINGVWDVARPDATASTNSN